MHLICNVVQIVHKYLLPISQKYWRNTGCCNDSPRALFAQSKWLCRSSDVLSTTSVSFYSMTFPICPNTWQLWPGRSAKFHHIYGSWKPKTSEWETRHQQSVVRKDLWTKHTVLGNPEETPMLSIHQWTFSILISRCGSFGHYKRAARRQPRSPIHPVLEA